LRIITDFQGDPHEPTEHRDIRKLIENVLEERKEKQHACVKEFMTSEMKRESFWDEHFQTRAFRRQIRWASVAALFAVLGVMSFVGVFALFLPLKSMSESVVAATKAGDDAKSQADAAKKNAIAAEQTAVDAKKTGENANIAARNLLNELGVFQEQFKNATLQSDFVAAFTAFSTMPADDRKRFLNGLEFQSQLNKFKSDLTMLRYDTDGLGMICYQYRSILVPGDLHDRVATLCGEIGNRGGYFDGTVHRTSNHVLP
jgi:hypothetical protein